MLDQNTKQKIYSARQILVGKVPDPKAQVDQITIALIYKFMDDMDNAAQEFGGKTRFFTGKFSQYSWTKLLNPRLSGSEQLDLYIQAISNMPKNPYIPQLFRDIFRDAFLPYKDSRTLSLFLKEINNFTYDNSENLGNAFEYLLSIMGSQGDAGQFRTPRHIIDFIVEVIDPKKNERILDPACGTAGFLISAYKHIAEQSNRKKITMIEKNKLMDNITGYDISPDMVKLALVNLYLHGFSEPKIYEYDTLTSEKRWDENFNVILANPPFMSPKGGIQPHNKFSVQANRSEVLFVDYIAEHLTFNGRAGIIVPEGIIFQSGNAYKELRKSLVNENYLYAVVSLPSGVFQPYSGMKTSILFLDRQIAKQKKNILFVRIDNDGFDLGAQRRPISANDLPEALKIINDWKADKNISKNNRVIVANKKQIAENSDYNLSAERYRIIEKRKNQKWEMVKLENIFFEIKNGKDVEQFDEVGKYRVSRIKTISSGIIDLKKTKWTNDDIEYNEFLKEGDILLSHINSIEHLAKSALFTNINEKIVHGNNLIRFRPTIDLINPFYAAKIFKSPQFISKAKIFAQKAVNQASIKISDLKMITIPLPPLDVQERIVAEIETYQKIIDGARQVIETWKPKIKVDEKWEMVKLGDICDVFIDGDWIESKDQSLSGIRLIQTGNIGIGQYLDKKNKARFVSDDTFKRLNCTEVLEGDVLISRLPDPVGRACLVPHIGTRCITAVDCTIIRFKKEKINADFFVFYSMSDKYFSAIEQFITGASRNRISRSNLSNITIPLPSLAVQE
ncbi:MAG: N-6 DNA methylase, partial [Planctomycetaceae bacterium]|nr:N-6 DNA methylase [Planctomycetaceae bacterium]